MQVPMSSPYLTDAEIAAVSQVLHTPVLSIGPQIEAFEQALSSLVIPAPSSLPTCELGSVV
jgi:perosamine synthetase